MVRTLFVICENLIHYPLQSLSCIRFGGKLISRKARKSQKNKYFLSSFQTFWAVDPKSYILNIERFQESSYSMHQDLESDFIAKLHKGNG